jgi:hypothetical protein
MKRRMDTNGREYSRFWVSQMDNGWLRLGLIAGLLAGMLVAGCTTRKVAAPPPPSYPAVSANSVRILKRLPSPPYDVVGTFTVQTDADFDPEKIIAEIRQKAGNSGANAIVLLSEKVFTWNNETIHQRLPTRRVVARALRLP